VDNPVYRSIQIFCLTFFCKKMKIKIDKILILPVLCECKTFFLTLKEEHRLKVFENRVLRKTFGSDKDEVIGD